MSAGKDMQIKLNLRFEKLGLPFELSLDTQIACTGVTVIWGRSGSGKTSLLRCIAGLQKTEQGLVSFKQQIWQSDSHFVPVHQRPIGYVFQEGSLFTHLTAKGNLDYAIKRAGSDVEAAYVAEVEQLMGIQDLLACYPEQLSGGERQRVAIARALLIKPQLLLMDEPLASLDDALKSDILPYLEKLHQQIDIPILYVTHARDEVARLADHILVLEQGKLIQHGPLEQVFPTLAFAAAATEQFVSVFKAKVIEQDPKWHLSHVDVGGFSLWLPDHLPLGEEVRVQIAAANVHLTLQAQPKSSVLNQFAAKVKQLSPLAGKSALVRVSLDIGETQLSATITQKSAAQLEIGPGSQVWANIKSAMILR